MPPTLLICDLAEPAVGPERQRALLSAAEQRRADALQRPAVRARYGVARALLRQALARWLDCSPQALAFDTAAGGKPYLATPGGYHFNISHSHQRVALALSTTGEVGVDIESRARRARIDALARHYFGEAEQQALQQLGDAERRTRFFQYWTIKEACTKALGRGLGSTLGGIRLAPEAVSGPTLRLEGGAACTQPAVYWHYRLDAAYSLACVQLGTDEPTEPAVFQVVRGGSWQPLDLTPDWAGWYEPAP
jgi:4'-phosphopantetheinyl transferase